MHFSTSSSTSTHSNHGPPPASPRKANHNKLRKARPDGYESDGGYVSDVTRKKPKNRSKKKDKEGPVTNDAESDGGYLSEASAKRKLSFFGRKKTKKSKDEERFPVPIPPVPQLTPQHPIADRFGGRSDTPSTFISSSRSSWTDAGTSRNATPIPPPSHSREDAIQALTHAFKEDAQSIAGSVDWSNTYSHFPRVVRSPQPPLPGSGKQTPSSSRPGPQPPPAPTLTPANVRPLKARPSPLSLSPLSSEYGHASDHSPVPSEMAMVSPDPASSMPSTGTVRKKLLIAVNTTPAALLPTHPSRSPSPIEPPLSFDFVIPSPSPGGSIRSRQFELPPPSPAPQGPLPKVPPILPATDQSQNSPLLKPGLLPQSRLAVGRLSPGLPPTRTPSPGIRGKEHPFPVNPSIRVQESTDTRNHEPYYPKKLNNPGWSVLRQPPPRSPSPTVSPRKSVGASSYASTNMELEIEAIEALYHDGGDGPNETPNYTDVDSVISMFGAHRESGYYDRVPRRSNDEESGNGPLSQPIRIPLDEDDYVSPTGGYLDMDSDLEGDYTSPKEDGGYSVWGRQSFMDESKSGETRNRFVRNVEAMYRKDGREMSMVDANTAPVPPLASRKPTTYI